MGVEYFCKIEELKSMRKDDDSPSNVALQLQTVAQIFSIP